MIRPVVAYGIALMPLAVVAAAFVAAALVLRGRVEWTRWRIAATLVIAGLVVGPIVYVVEGVWLGRYGLATMHLVELCGPVDGLRSAWQKRTDGGLDANGFFWCATGFDDPGIQCIGQRE